MEWVVHVGLAELAVGGLLGWAMVLKDQRPDLIERIGIKVPARIRQVHLDYVMMGLILIAVGLAVPSLADPIAIALVFGTIVNPLLFVPPAFEPEVERRVWYRAIAIVSFVCVSGGLVATAITGPG